MQINQNTDNQNFNGNLYILNELSKKPAQCISKEKSNLTKLIRKEKFDLFIKQDYSKNVVNIIALQKDTNGLSAVNSVSVTAKPGVYTITAMKSIEKYKELQEDMFENTCKKKRTLKEKFYNLIEKFIDKYGES